MHTYLDPTRAEHIFKMIKEKKRYYKVNGTGPNLKKVEKIVILHACLLSAWLAGWRAFSNIYYSISRESERANERDRKEKYFFQKKLAVIP